MLFQAVDGPLHVRMIWWRCSKRLSYNKYPLINLGEWECLFEEHLSGLQWIHQFTVKRLGLRPGPMFSVVMRIKQRAGKVVDGTYIGR